jgi:hypothetical protein
MRYTKPLITTLCALSLCCVSGRAANLTTTNIVGAGSSWLSTIWKTNSFGLATNTAPAIAGPVIGNTYETVPNKVVGGIGNNLNETRLRNPASAGQARIQTFVGDSLTLWTNTEIRFKLTNSSIAAFPPICNFPGVGGNPGLIFKGGMLNAGDSGVFPITGAIQALPGTQSYICPGNNDFASVDANRGFNIAGQLTGSGTLVVLEGGAPAASATNGAAQTISGTSNSFSGQWFVKAGWLLATGTNCLGTNSITMDPNWTVPVPPFSSTNLGTPAVGPALLELGYNINSAGTLTLVNGGRLRLHQHGIFSAVVIEGNSLSAGTHLYSELVNNYPNNIDPNGSGSLTVQPTYGTPPALVPIILSQPLPQTLYAGQTAHFNVSVTAFGGVTYQWRKDTVNLMDSGNVSGSTTASLTITGVGAGNVGSYDCIVTAGTGGLTDQSQAAALSLAILAGGTYESAVVASNAIAYYELNELNDPSTNPPAYDYVGGHDGVYGAAVQNGFTRIVGPQPTDGFPGMRSGNTAASFSSTANARVTLPGLNLNTNTVTITAWIYPTAIQPTGAGIVFCRGADPNPGLDYASTVAGLNYSTNHDLSGNTILGYTWNNDGNTSGWNTGLVPPQNQWSFVALSVSSTNASIYLINTNGLLSRTLVFNHVNQSFAAPTLIGDDSADNGIGTRAFIGSIDEVAIFNQAFSRDQIIGLYGQGGVPLFAPIIGTEPLSQTVNEKSVAQLSVIAGGTTPLTFQWKAGPIGSDPSTFTNVLNSATISGATTTALSFTPAGVNNTADYQVIVTGAIAPPAVSSVATLTVLPVGLPTAIIMTVQQANGSDWNTAADWNPNGSATDWAYNNPGSTFSINPPGRMRTPTNNVSVHIFPATNPYAPSVLSVNGDSIFANNPGSTTATIGEIRFKHPTDPGTVTFQKLVMNGGQLDNGDNGRLIIAGEMDILTNTPIYIDSSAANSTRAFQIDAWLTGNGSIEYHSFANNAFNTEDLNITGTSNTFSGTWNIVQGALLGSAPNALGPGNILIGTNAALETTYNVTNLTGNLYLSGVMFLHQDDTFHALVIGTNAVPVGVHPFSELNANFPANFPSLWTAIRGSTNTTGSGSITVLAVAPPAIQQQPVSAFAVVGYPASFSVSAVGGQPLYYHWQKNGTNLTDGGTISGSTTTTLSNSAVALSDAGSYTVVITNSGGGATSQVATLTVVPIGPPENITLTTNGAPVIQPNGSDWDTPNNWSDGYPASISSLAKPNSTYEVVVGARMRTPNGATNAVFPGNRLTVDGDGVFSIPLTTTAEVRLKPVDGFGTIYFKKLVMNGGQIDTAPNSFGTSGIQGEMDINANTTLYNDSGNDRGFRIDAWLTGTGLISYYGVNNPTTLNPAFTNTLNITCPTNTFSGPWHIFGGTLLGSSMNSLGTNNITIDAPAAFETLYDMNSPEATLDIEGAMYLHQNYIFANVTVGGAPLAPGTYPYSTLAASYPNNFPANWTMQVGSTFSSASSLSTITVLGSAPPRPTIQVSFSGSHLTLTWPAGFWLVEANDVTGPWVTNTAATSPFQVTPTAPRQFFGLQRQ